MSDGTIGKVILPEGFDEYLVDEMTGEKFIFENGAIYRAHTRTHVTIIRMITVLPGNRYPLRCERTVRIISQDPTVGFIGIDERTNRPLFFRWNGENYEPTENIDFSEDDDREYHIVGEPL